jgi:hypothetical protein
LTFAVSDEWLRCFSRPTINVKLGKLCRQDRFVSSKTGNLCRFCGEELLLESLPRIVPIILSVNRSLSTN